MQFRNPSKDSPPPYFNRKDRIRMYKLVGALTLVLIGIQFAADPDTWRWMFPQQADAQPEGPAEKEAPEREIDFSVRFDEDDPLPPGAFRSRPRPAGVVGVSKAEGGDRSDDDAGSDARGDALIDPAVLEPVRDDYVGIRHFELDAFYQVLAAAGAASPQALREAAGEHVPFSTLMNDPAHYRGRPVHVEGTLRRLERIPAGENDFGVKAYWEGWLFTAESDANPYRLVIAAAPDDVPHGETIEVPVAFTGYFFKLQGYESVGGFHKAPVLIGPTIRPLPVRDDLAAPQDLGMVPYVIGFAVLVAAALGLTLWRFARSDRAFGDRHVHAFTDAAPEDVAALQNVEAVEMDEVLRRLAAEEDR